MRNFVTGCIVLLAMAGTACNKDSKPPKPSQQDATTQKTDVGSKTHGPLQEVAVDLGGGVKMELVLIPAGEFLMGNDRGFGPIHKVRITKPFYLGKYLVTQEQWQAVMGSNPSNFKGPKNPVERVSWDNCQEFIEKLNANVAGGKGRFALPTEAQWEYACRAGSTTKYCFGDDDSQLGEYAWYGGNSGNQTHPGGEKRPNAWGLYDMHGNVYEWCQDWYVSNYYANSPTDDPTGPSGELTSFRVIRGGACATAPGSAFRRSAPGAAFRRAAPSPPLPRTASLTRACAFPSFRRTSRGEQSRCAASEQFQAFFWEDML